MAKTILFDATGARHTYELLWDVALVHANDLINHLPEAGSDSPVVRAGGEKFDIRTAMGFPIEVFGCRVYAYKNVIRKNGKVDITSQECTYLGTCRPWPQYDRASRPSSGYLGPYFSGLAIW